MRPETANINPGSLIAQVDPLPGTSDAPTDQTDHLKPSVDRNHQRTAAVTLATVPSSLLVAGTQEVLGINSLFPDAIIVVIITVVDSCCQPEVKTNEQE